MFKMTMIKLTALALIAAAGGVLLITGFALAAAVAVPVATSFVLVCPMGRDDDDDDGDE